MTCCLFGISVNDAASSRSDGTLKICEMAPVSFRPMLRLTAMRQTQHEGENPVD